MRATEIITEQKLDEIAMSPTALNRLASTINAEAGMEFEMYVPDIASGTVDEDEDGPSPESIDDICEFFDTEDNDIHQLRTWLENEFAEYTNAKGLDEWDSVERNEITKYLNDKYDFEQRAIDELETETGDTYYPVDDEVRERADQLLMDAVDETIDMQSGDWETVRTNWERGYEIGSETDWVRETYPYMSHVSSAHGLVWPASTLTDEALEDLRMNLNA